MNFCVPLEPKKKKERGDVSQQVWHDKDPSLLIDQIYKDQHLAALRIHRQC